MGLATEYVDSATATTERLTRLWPPPRSILAWLATVDHKTLGKRYIYHRVRVLRRSAASKRRSSARSSRGPTHICSSPEAYNQLFTMHGVTMMFLFVQPVLSGFSFYLTPFMIGARELAFPRLNSFSYYVLLLAGIFIYASFLIGQAPNAGWFNYTPLSRPLYNSGLNIDFYALGLLFLGISTTAGACNFDRHDSRSSAHRACRSTACRCFSGARSPMSVAVIFCDAGAHGGARDSSSSSDTGISCSSIRSSAARRCSGSTCSGCSATRGCTSCSCRRPGCSRWSSRRSARRPMVGHTFVALATVITGLVGFGVWVHHMFATGLPQLSMSFFGAASMTVSIPSAVKIFAWIATMWYGRVVFATPCCSRSASSCSS